MAAVLLGLLFAVSGVWGAFCGSYNAQDTCEGAAEGCRWAVVPGTGLYSGLRCTKCTAFENGTDCSVCDEGAYTSSGCPSSVGCKANLSGPDYCTGTMTVPQTFFTDGACNGEDNVTCKGISKDCGWSGLKDSKVDCAEKAYKCQCYNKTVHCTDNDTTAECSSCHSQNACEDTTGEGYRGTKTCRWSTLYGGMCTSCGDIKKGESCSNCDGDYVTCLFIDGCTGSMIDPSPCTGTMNVDGAVAIAIPSFILLLLLFLSLFGF